MCTRVIEGMSAPQESGTLEPAAAAAGGAPPPAPPTIAAGKGTGAVGGMDDADEAAAKQTFDAALSLCAKECSDAQVAAVRALFAGAVQRGAGARKRRDEMEDRCNQVAAENEAVSSDLKISRAAFARAQTSKLSMETKCREQAQLNQRAVEHVKAAAAGEESRNAELQEKFDVAVPSIKEKLELEEDRRRIQRENNDELRGKLTNFAEQARLSKESFAAQLQPGVLRIQISKVKGDQKEAERRVHEAKADEFGVELQRAAESHARMKADATERERSLSKIQAILNERKKMTAALEAKTKELLATKASLETEVPILREIVASEEAANGHKKMLDRLQGLCCQLESDVEAKRLELGLLEGRTSSR